MNRRFGKRIVALSVWTACIGLLGVLMVLLIDNRVQQVGEQYIVSAEKAPQADAILVLGAYARPDGQPSDMLRDRLLVSKELYDRHISSKVLVSGDHGRVDYDEVNTMRSFLAARDVRDEDIFMDHAGFSTYESLYRARDIFQVKKVVIVTQEYHLKRAIYVARQLGLEAYGVVADLETYRGMPKFKTREIAARNKDFLMVHVLNLRPTYLGNAIPITSDGRLTWDKK